MAPVRRRLTRDAWGLVLANAVSRRADCSRRQVGAVVVDSEGRIVSVGYNGAPAGRPGCLSNGACPRGKKSYVEVPKDSDYSDCIAVHAEANALLYATRQSLIGGTMYITDPPCTECLKLIIGAGIEWVKYPNGGVKVN